MRRMLTACLLSVPLFSSCSSSDPDDMQAQASDSVAAMDGKDATVPTMPSTSDLPSRTFRFTYAVTVPAAPEGTGKLRLWVPLGRNDPGVQQISQPAIEAPPGYRVTMDPVYGNPMIYCEVENPTEPTRVAWSATILRIQDVGQGHGPMNDRYLQPNQRIPLTGTATDMAAQLGANDTNRPVVARAQLIYDDVLNGMSYDKTVPGYGFGDFERSVTVCKGNCTDFHSRFIGVGRAAGIPVRFTMGIPLKPDPEGTYNSYHCWAHYRDGESWRPVDISEADKVADTDPDRARWFFGNLDENRVTIGYGRDLTLEPAQDGPVLNYFVFPYAEADGAEMPLDKTMWEFTYKNL